MSDWQQPDLNDPNNFLRNIDNPIERFNLFIKKWCPNYSHLIDNDQNDGEEIRAMIANLNRFTIAIRFDVTEPGSTDMSVLTKDSVSPDAFNMKMHGYSLAGNEKQLDTKDHQALEHFCKAYLDGREAKKHV